MSKTNKQPTIGEVRAQLFNTLTEVRAGLTSPEEAHAVYRLSIGIIDTFRLEIRAVELANSMNKKRLPYGKVLQQIEQKTSK